MELSFIVPDQEVDGSNPFAPTILFKSAIYITPRIGILEEKSKKPGSKPAKQPVSHSTSSPTGDRCPTHFAQCEDLPFDISHNRCRLVTWINYRGRKVFIRYMLSHADYDKEKWKDDGDCD
jgi:hypothetical protein